MSSKSNTEVIIGGRVYTLSGYEGEEYLQRVAAYINNKINEFQDMEGVRSLTPDMKATLLEINIADDYFKAKERVDRLEQSLEQKEKELYDIKHELIAAKIEAESAEKNQKELEEKNKELLLNKAKLETALEDALLGAVPAEPSNEQTVPTDAGQEQETVTALADAAFRDPVEAVQEDHAEEGVQQAPAEETVQKAEDPVPQEKHTVRGHTHQQHWSKEHR